MSSEQKPSFDLKSLSAEEFEEKYIPALNTVAELVLSHPDIPEEIQQSDLLGAITTISMEMRNSLNGRVPEITKLQEALAKKENQVRKLQETNQQLFLKVGTHQDSSKKQEDQERPKKSFAEIKAIIENL